MIKLIPRKGIARNALAIVGSEVSKGIFESRPEIVVGAKNIKAGDIQELIEGIKDYWNGIYRAEKISRADY